MAEIGGKPVLFGSGSVSFPAADGEELTANDLAGTGTTSIASARRADGSGLAGFDDEAAE